MSDKPSVAWAFLGSPVGGAIAFGALLLENTITPSAGDHNVMPAITVSHWWFPSILAAAVTVALWAAAMRTDQ